MSGLHSLNQEYQNRCKLPGNIIDVSVVPQIGEDFSNSHLSTDMIEDDQMIAMEEENKLARVSGNLLKWTNYINGWQERFFALQDGNLSYYRSYAEEDLGCRGSLKLKNAFIYPHDFDECRFEVRVSDSIWYLRGTSRSERDDWISKLQAQRRVLLTESGYGSEQNLHCMKDPSRNSLLSFGRQSRGSSSLQKNHLLLTENSMKEKLAEIESFKEILFKQLDSLQTYFDMCSKSVTFPEHFDDEVSLNINDDSNLFDEYNNNTRTSSSMRCSSSPSDHLREGNEEEPLMEMQKSQLVREYVAQLPVPEMNDTASLSSQALEDSLFQDEFASVLDGTFSVSTEHSTPRATTPKEQPQQSSFFSRTGINLLSRLLPFSSGKSAPVKSAEEASVPHADLQKMQTSSEEQEALDQQLPYELLRRVIEQHGGRAIDFKCEAHTFKASSIGVITSLEKVLEQVTTNDERWMQRLDKERKERKQLEEACRLARDELTSLRSHLAIGAFNSIKPQSMEQSHRRVMSEAGAAFTGSNSIVSQQPKGQAEMKHLGASIMPNCPDNDFERHLREEEFFDAIDAHFDQLEKEEERLEALKQVGDRLQMAPSCLSAEHPLYQEIEKTVLDRVRLFQGAPTLSDLERMNQMPDAGSWQIILRDGPMTVYNRELESTDGIVMDPLQALHTVEGVTAREMCNCFWDVRYRLDWEITIDQAPTVLEISAEDTIVIHQIYKRVWPATQRESVMWSHIRRLDEKMVLPRGENNNTNDEILDSWIVVNMSTQYKDSLIEPSTSPLIRLGIDVVLVCQTVVENLSPGEKVNRETLTRDRLKCRLFYAAQIDPGGWAPASVLRQLARREYPRFLKRFSSFVQNYTEPLMPAF